MKRLPGCEHLKGMGGVSGTVAIERSDVELALDGDAVAFGRLVARFQVDVTRLAYVIVGDATLAEDAAQATWVAAWTRLRSLREHSKIRSWLLSIAANEARQLLRRRRRVPVVEIDPGIASGPRSDPASGIARLDLVRALGRLSPDDRALLALRYVAGLDATELGRLTGRSASGTRARLSRLTARLREELDR